MTLPNSTLGAAIVNRGGTRRRGPSIIKGYAENGSKGITVEEKFA